MDMLDKAKLVITNPDNFFKDIKSEPGLLNSWKYYAILIFITCILTIIFSIPSIVIDILKETAGVEAAIALVIALFIALFIFGGLYAFLIGFIFVMSGLSHLLLLIVGAKGGFEQTFKIVCYSSTAGIFLAPLIIFDIIPVYGTIIYSIGTFVVSIYQIILSVKGAVIIHEISLTKAIIALVVIPLAIVILIIGVIVFAAFMFYSKLITLPV